MNIIIGFLIFCIVLFFYLHIYFQLKTSNDLEVFEIEQPAKEKHEEICDLRQPILFPFNNDKMVDLCNRQTISDSYGAFDVKIRTIDQSDDDGKDLYSLISLKEGLKILDEDKAGNFRSLDNLVMKGDEVFLFVQKEVPLMIDELMEASAFTKNDVDYFMFHQPNRFMLQKLAEKMKIPFEKMPNNIVANFGNSSGVTIPTNISFNLGAKLENSIQKICMAGFGVGLTWASLLMDLGNLRYNKIIRY